MANTLLSSSSSWFMRPKHLQRDVSLKRSSYATFTQDTITFVSPEEEYSIRKYCPVTLNHILPDLHFTRTELVQDAADEFDAQLLTKFEKHLEESHQVLSGSSTSRSIEEQDSDDSESDSGEAIQIVSLENTNAIRKLLLPNKVDLDYPNEGAQLQLPEVELNNRRSSSPVFTKSFCTGCINRNTSSACVPKNKVEMERRNNASALGFCEKGRCGTVAKRFPSLTDGSQVQVNDIKSSFTKNVFTKSEKKENVLLEREKKNQKYLRAVASSGEISRFESSNRRSRPHPSRHTSPSVHRPPDDHLSVPPQQQRSRSTSPCGRGSGEVPASPHMVELARLRRERLRLEERMLLKRRQVMELDRLRPPVDKWYEMKDTRFHQEAHRHNIYLKNQNIIPLVEDRRKLLYQTITAKHY